MGELIILLIGAFISGILALLKLGAVINMGWFGVCVPLLISLVLIGIMWVGLGDDGLDFDFDI